MTTNPTPTDLTLDALLEKHGVTLPTDPDELRKLAKFCRSLANDADYDGTETKAELRFALRQNQLADELDRRADDLEATPAA